jgi:hypothetical protein
MRKVVDLAEVRLRRNAERWHALGPRVLYEFLTELARKHSRFDTIEQLASRYGELDPEVIRALGADRFPPEDD